MTTRFAALLLITTAAITACASVEEANKLDEDTDVYVVGMLRTGVMAPNGDTTGIVVAAYDGLHYELIVEGAKLDLARRLDGQHVWVAGTLDVRDSAGGNKRLLLTVKRLRHEPLK